MIFFPLFALRGMGAGDVKLVAALSAWLGPVEAVYLAIFASLAGGVVAIVVVRVAGIPENSAVERLADADPLAGGWAAAGAGFTLQDTRAPRLAFAIPITIGLVCTLWRL